MAKQVSKAGVIATTGFDDATSEAGVIRNSSTLLPTSSNFLSAIEDPDYMFSDVCFPFNHLKCTISK